MKCYELPDWPLRSFTDVERDPGYVWNEWREDRIPPLPVHYSEASCVHCGAHLGTARNGQGLFRTHWQKGA
jgi:hypothetical protein